MVPPGPLSAERARHPRRLLALEDGLVCLPWVDEWGVYNVCILLKSVYIVIQ